MDNDVVAFAAEVWARLEKEDVAFRLDFFNELKDHCCTNCGGDGQYCCYDSAPEYLGDF